MFVARHPQSDLRLVCPGALDAPLESIRTATVRMGLEKRVHFPGFMPDSELAALFQLCRSVLFPSLYEGFGMPVLEAMAFGKVVLCSNVTSLPEIAGDAALFFDPRKPAEIVNAICQLESDSALAARLVERGYQRVRNFGDSTKMAQQYLQVFREAVGDFCM
jgi:glycosyltransferase involved in cell wall biosynthesis